MTLATGITTIALSTLTPNWLKKNYLTGLKICDADGQEYSNDFYETHMMNAVRRIEGITNVSILENTIVGEEHDYRVGDYMIYSCLQVFKTPVRSVSRISAVYPLGQVIQEFPPEWIRLEALHGQIHLVPSRGSLAQIILGQGGAFLPLIYGGLSYLPALWAIDYIAGMDPEDLPRDVVEAIAKLAAIDILTIASNLIRPIGVTSESVSIDGLSQSQSYQVPALIQHIGRYTEDLWGPNGKQQDMKTTSGLLRQIHDQFFGFNLASLY